MNKSPDEELVSLLPTVSLLSLDKGALTEMLLRFHPRDVLSMMKINRRFALLSRDQGVFLQLIAKHYPQEFATDDPRKQYIAITREVETIYTIDGIIESNGSIKSTGPIAVRKSTKPELSPGWSLYNVHRSKIVRLLEKFIFLKWFSEEERNELSLAKHRIMVDSNKFPSASFFVSSYDQALEPIMQSVTTHFLRFVNACRTYGLENLLRTNSNQAQESESVGIIFHDASEFSVYADQCYITQFKDLIGQILTQGKQLYSTGHRQLPFTIRGNKIPSGMTMWACVDYDRRKFILAKTRGEMALQLATKYHFWANKYLLKEFKMYLMRNYPDHVFPDHISSNRVFPDGTSMNYTIIVDGIEIGAHVLFSEFLKETKTTLLTKKIMMEAAMTQQQYDVICGAKSRRVWFCILKF